MAPQQEYTLGSRRFGSKLTGGARPGDAANAVAFLISDRSAYVIGQRLGVNGGFVMV